jgi:hypothetical protein
VQFEHILEGGWDEVTTVGMVLCERCGAPVHAETLPGDVTGNVGDLVEPLCEKHRSRRAARTLARFPTTRKALGPEKTS